MFFDAPENALAKVPWESVSSGLEISEAQNLRTSAPDSDDVSNVQSMTGSILRCVVGPHTDDSRDLELDIC